MRATVYARFSTELQRNKSIEDQVEVCSHELDRIILIRTNAQRMRQHLTSALIDRSDPRARQ
jgi:hypothetical protein